MVKAELPEPKPSGLALDSRQAERHKDAIGRATGFALYYRRGAKAVLVGYPQ
jgi:hypothetical protein